MQIGKQMNLSEFRRRPACEVRIGGVTIGGKHPVAVQSMTNTDTKDTEACVRQIEKAERSRPFRPLRPRSAQRSARAT